MGTALRAFGRASGMPSDGVCGMGGKRGFHTPALRFPRGIFVHRGCQILDKIYSNCVD